LLTNFLKSLIGNPFFLLISINLSFISVKSFFFFLQKLLHVEFSFKKDSIILHPLARGPELSTSLDQTSRNWYFAQSRGAVFVRMALLTCLMDRTTRVMDVV